MRDDIGINFRQSMHFGFLLFPGIVFIYRVGCMAVRTENAVSNNNTEAIHIANVPNDSSKNFNEAN